MAKFHADLIVNSFVNHIIALDKSVHTVYNNY